VLALLRRCRAPGFLATLVACGSSLPAPALIAQPKDAFQEVPHPPPAALVELVASQPSRRAVWIDGNWAWRGKGFVWQRGGWVEPPAGARYAPWQVRYLADGTLLFASCGWFDAHGQPIESPPILVPASTPPNEVTSEFHSAR
jgi:hypothetical protein